MIQPGSEFRTSSAEQGEQRRLTFEPWEFPLIRPGGGVVTLGRTFSSNAVLVEPNANKS